MSKKKKTARKRKQSTYDEEAYVCFICAGLNGKGCGTSEKKISFYRKEKTWEEICDKFQHHQGD